jgi:integrase
VPIFPAVERELVALLERELVAGRGGELYLVFCTRTGSPVNGRNVAQRGVEKAVAAAGLGKVAPHDLRRSFCSLAGRRGVDPIEAAQITGHSPAVWALVRALVRQGAARRSARPDVGPRLRRGDGHDEDEVRAEDEAAAAS